MTAKTILITGASRGIGAAAARLLGSQGHRLAVAARSLDALAALAEEINAGPGEAIALQCDVSNAADVALAVSETVQRYGRLDVLVNNAGLIEPIAHIADIDPDAWSQVVDVNTKGVFYGLRYAIPPMLEQGGGTVINISSGAATKALEGWSHYCATKAAVLSLTRCAHVEYGDRGITVVGMSPGTVATDMQVKIKASGVNPVSQLDFSSHIPPEWVAQGIAFLLTEGGDAFRGTDFSLKTDEGRRLAGLPAA